MKILVKFIILIVFIIFTTSAFAQMNRVLEKNKYAVSYDSTSGDVYLYYLTDSNGKQIIKTFLGVFCTNPSWYLDPITNFFYFTSYKFRDIGTNCCALLVVEYGIYELKQDGINIVEEYNFDYGFCCTDYRDCKIKDGSLICTHNKYIYKPIPINVVTGTFLDFFYHQ